MNEIVSKSWLQESGHIRRNSITLRYEKRTKWPISMDLHNFRIHSTCQYLLHRSHCGQYYLVLFHFVEGNEVYRRVRKIAKSKN